MLTDEIRTLGLAARNIASPESGLVGMFLQEAGPQLTPQAKALEAVLETEAQPAERNSPWLGDGGGPLTDDFAKAMEENLGETEKEGYNEGENGQSLRPANDQIKLLLQSEGLNQSKIDEIVSLKNTQKPAPREYLSETYIENHLREFRESGCVKIIANAPTGKIGWKKGVFVLSANELNQIILEAKGDIALIEKALGLTQGSLGNNPVIVEIPQPNNLRMPRGNEPGALPEYWIPGGYTLGGVKEAVIDVVPKGKYTWRYLF